VITYILGYLTIPNLTTLRFDSSTLTRYGTQVGAKKGYDLHKPVPNLHHPLMAFVADLKLMSNFWLRSGNSSAADGFIPFLEDTLRKLKNKTVELLRMDSGFYSKSIFDYLEKRTLNYIVAAKFYKPIQQMIAQNTVWLTIDKGTEIAEISYQGQDWDNPRRIAVVRQKLQDKPNAPGKSLKLF
jgi:hypothetical protein